MNNMSSVPITQSTQPATPTSPIVPTDTNVQQTGGLSTLAGGGDAESTSFKDLGELRAKHPEFYDKMMEGIMTNIINQMKASQERLEEMWRKGRSQ